MPTKFAMRTSILSKRWRHSWIAVTNLNFEDIHTIARLHSMTNIVDRVLQFCAPSQLKLLRLHFPVIHAQNSSVTNWIDNVVRLNIRELDLHVHPHRLPFSIFTCKSLTKLKLRLNYGCYDVSVWELSCPVDLPCLKTLDIAVNQNPVVNAFKIITGCPILESLTLEVSYLNDEEDYSFNNPTLKRLELNLLYPGFDSRVVLHVPNLEHLLVGGILCSVFVMEDVSSLVEASVSFFYIMNDHLWFELLKGLSGVRSLSVQYIPSSTSLSPVVFPNMKHLMLKSSWCSGLILQFLGCSPELKHLYIEEKQNSSGSQWIEPKSVPACMLTSLRTLKFSIWQSSWKCDISFLKYMLGNAEVLETLSITWENSRVEEESRLCAELLKLPRNPKCSEIHFHGPRLPADYL